MQLQLQLQLPAGGTWQETALLLLHLSRGWGSCARWREPEVHQLLQGKANQDGQQHN